MIYGIVVEIVVRTSLCNVSPAQRLNICRGKLPHCSVLGKHAEGMSVHHSHQQSQLQQHPFLTQSVPGEWRAIWLGNGAWSKFSTKVA